MGHDPMVTRLYSLRKPAPNVAAFGRASEGYTGALALIFTDIPKRKVPAALQTLSRGFFVAAAAAHTVK